MGELSLRFRDGSDFQHLNVRVSRLIVSLRVDQRHMVHRAMLEFEAQMERMRQRTHHRDGMRLSAIALLACWARKLQQRAKCLTLIPLLRNCSAVQELLNHYLTEPCRVEDDFVVDAQSLNFCVDVGINFCRLIGIRSRVVMPSVDHASKNQT